VKNGYFMKNLILILIPVFSLCILNVCKNADETMDKIYYAKDALLNNVLIHHIDQFKFGRTGYVGHFSEDTSSVTFTVSVPRSDNYDIVVSSANPAGRGEKYNYVLVNGKQAGEFKTLDNNVFNDSVIKRVYIEKGKTEITIQKYWGWIYVDYILLRKSGEINYDIYDVSPALVNPNADNNAKRLMKYITDIYGRQTLSGQCGEGISGDDFKAVYSVTGKYPAVMMLDMMDYSPSRVKYGTRGKSVEAAIEWHKLGGVVKFLWHWNAPKDLIDSQERKWWSGFYTDATNFNLAKALSGEDAEGYDLLISDIDAIAFQLTRLRDAGIPVLWRPLHEASGGWFWWGASGADNFKKLWILLFERLTYHHQLNNLIWIWNGQDKNWFPGAEYVDLVGEDVYAQKRNYSSQVHKFFEIAEYLHELDAMKVIGLTECATVPDINEMERDKAMWFMFAVWNSDFVRNRNSSVYSQEYTESSHLKKMYDDERVITLDDLPDLKNYPLN